MGVLPIACITTFPRAFDHSNPSSPPLPNPGVVHSVASSKESRQDDPREENARVQAIKIKNALHGKTKTAADRDTSELPPLFGGCWGGGGAIPPLKYPFLL